MNNQLFDLVLGQDIPTPISDFYISKATNTLKYYLNVTDLQPYESQIIDLAVYYYRNRQLMGVSQASQGSRSQALREGIPQDIIDTLPLPKIKVVG